VQAELLDTQKNAEAESAGFTSEHEQAISRLQQDLEAAQNLMDEEQMRFANKCETLQISLAEAQIAHRLVLERVAELEANLSAQAQAALEREQKADDASNSLASEEFAEQLSAKLAEQQTTFEAEIEQHKREAQIRLEMELDVTRQVLSIKDREIELLRTNIETLQASTTRAEASAHEREMRINELEVLLGELEARRLRSQHTSEAPPHLPSMSSAERTALTSKVRQMLSRVEAALEEEVR
jgi:hypothetical protein